MKRAICLSVLLAMAMISCQSRAEKERMLRDELFTMRSFIDQYTLDKQKEPHKLEDLVSAGYLKEIPVDPFTGRRDTWQVVIDDTLADPVLPPEGIADVHSGSNGVGTDGTAYNTW